MPDESPESVTRFSVRDDEDLARELSSKKWNKEGHFGPVTCIEVINGVLYSSSTDRTTIAYDITSGDTLQVFRGHAQEVVAIQVDIVTGNLFTGSLYDDNHWRRVT